VRPLLAGLEKLYAVGVRARNARFDRQAPKSLLWPVISVGNLSVGGSGKTPLVILVAQLLAAAGWTPDVLSRGYGRHESTVERVEPGGPANRFGDEPLMIAQAGIPVFVASSRYQAGLLAERTLVAGSSHVHLLDDGFQHRELARKVDVVAIHRCDVDDRLLPAGRLREPLAGLRRADAIVVREDDGSLLPRLMPYARPGACFWQIRRKLLLDGDWPEKPVSAIAFCAIARPEEFFQMLEGRGIRLAGKITFRDHHRYTTSDVESLRELGARNGVAAFLTTEKDAVKLDAGLLQALGAPLRVARLAVEFAGQTAVMQQLVAMLDGADSTRAAVIPPIR
jgi:tetraacyldisaccharide 4'-kinase